MNKNSFYIELQSNSKCYSDNTVANFRNKISLRNILTGRWSVALVEISYTYSWKNLPSSQWITIDLETNKDPDIHLEEVKKVKAGFYESIEQLIAELTRKVNKYKKDIYDTLPEFHLDKINKLLYIRPGRQLDGKLILPVFSQELAEILGFPNYSIHNLRFNQDNQVVSVRPPDLYTALHSLFIYSDIVEPQYIGDIQAKLLKTVEVPNDIKFGDQIVIKYDNPHYIPLLFHEFDSIEIDIKNDLNERIPFLFGRTRVKLHLTKDE